MPFSNASIKRSYFTKRINCLRIGSETYTFPNVERLHELNYKLIDQVLSNSQAYTSPVGKNFTVIVDKAIIAFLACKTYTL